MGIFAAVVVVLATVNLNLALNSKSNVGVSLKNIITLATPENNNGEGYARVGLEDLGECMDCQNGKEYICAQMLVFCEGSGALTPDEPCGSTKWGGCQATGFSCN